MKILIEMEVMDIKSKVTIKDMVRNTNLKHRITTLATHTRKKIIIKIVTIIITITMIIKRITPRKITIITMKINIIIKKVILKKRKIQNQLMRVINTRKSNK